MKVNGINRVGGKAYLSQWLCSFIPQHRLFCEPFAGGARVLFEKLPSPVEILNDTDGDLVNLYRCVQNPGKRLKLIGFLNETPYSRSVFQSWKYGKDAPADDIERAGRYFYLCKTSFGGDIERGGFALPSRGTGRNPAKTYQAGIEALEHIAQRLKGVTIENLNYGDCIRRYDSPESFFYIDGPYYGHEHYYGDIFTQDDHCKLSELLHGIKGQVMVSHYDNELYSTLYKGWNKYTYRGFKGSSKAQPGAEKPKTIECLWCNFKPETGGLFNEYA